MCPPRRAPKRFLPSSWIIKDFASLANLAIITSKEKPSVSSETSGTMSVRLDW